MNKLKSFLSALLLLLASQVHAELEIDIIAGVEGAIPIAVVPFPWQGEGPPPPHDVARIVHDDLARSGQFQAMDRRDMVSQPSEASDIRFGAWRMLKTDYILIGKTANNPGGYKVEFQLFNVHSGERLLGYVISGRFGEERQLAHKISDMVYEKIIGIAGAFNTRVAYVVANRKEGRRYALVVSDADGYGPQYPVQSDEPILSPSWSPDGRSLAYVSFERGNSSIYMQNLATGQRELLASNKGINGAPSWSPDGKKLAMALSKSGNLEIYVLDIESRRLRQITNHWSIDTEPAWMPDGKSLVFTSDRGGRPQLYQVPAGGGKARRLTFEGDYNAKASIDATGKSIALVHGNDNDYRIAVLNLETGIVRLLTPGFLDESPSFAPNGSMILYAASEGDRGVLAAVSSDGRVRQRLVLSHADVREPAWSPFRQ